MAKEYRAQQGTLIPTMFIGLGGIGSRIVDRIFMCRTGFATPSVTF
jgi:hypothetical protein